MHQLSFTPRLGLFQPGLRNMLFSSSVKKIISLPKNHRSSGELRREEDANCFKISAFAECHKGTLSITL